MSREDWLTHIYQEYEAFMSENKAETTAQRLAVMQSLDGKPEEEKASSANARFSTTLTRATAVVRSSTTPSIDTH